jgi:hypothetical protein
LSTCRGIVEKAKAIDMGYGLFMIIIFFILLLVLIFFFTDVYFELTNY